MEKKRDVGIDVMRLICAVLVISIHTRSCADININIDFWINDFIARIAVPFFFMTSGYYFYNKYINDNKYLVKYLKNIISIYIIWSIFYIGWDIFLQARGAEISVGYFFNLAKRLLLTGSNTILWYIPALVISIIFVSIFMKKQKYELLIIVGGALFVLGLLGDSYFFIIEDTKLIQLVNIYNIIFLSTRNGFCIAVPFITIGVCINRWSLYNLLKKRLKIIVPLSLIMVLEAYLLKYKLNVTTFNMYFTSVLVYPLIFILILKFNNRVQYKFKYIRDLSMNIYFSHGIFLIIYRYIFNYFDINGVFGISFIKFIFVTISSILFSLAIIFIKNIINNKRFLQSNIILNNKSNY